MSHINNTSSRKGEGWVEKKLGELGEIQTGSTPKTSQPDNFGDFIPFIKPGDFYADGRINYNNKGLSEKGLEGSRYIDAGSLLMVCIGSTIGKVGFNDREVAANQQINALTSTPDISSKFLYYQMLTSSFQKAVLANSGQTTLPIINKTKWSNLTVSVPSLPEQKRIVTIIDEAFVGIAQAVANAESNLANASELFESFLNSVFTQKGEGWVVSSLGESCDFFNGKAHEKKIDANGQFIVINSKFISSGGQTFKKTNDALFPLYKYDIVMVMSDVPNGKALAKCFLVDEDGRYTLNQRICCIRSDRFEKRFLFYHLNRHPFLLNFNNGENQTNLRKGDILRCPLYIPETSQQRKLADQLDGLLLETQHLETIYQKKLTALAELKQSILQKAFAGDLTADVVYKQVVNE